MRLATALLTLLLSACGQSGDLYLPAEAPAAEAPSLPEPEKTDEKKDAQDATKDAQ